MHIFLSTTRNVSHKSNEVIYTLVKRFPFPKWDETLNISCYNNIVYFTHYKFVHTTKPSYSSSTKSSASFYYAKVSGTVWISTRHFWLASLFTENCKIYISFQNIGSLSTGCGSSVMLESCCFKSYSGLPLIIQQKWKPNIPMGLFINMDQGFGSITGKLNAVISEWIQEG